MRFDGNLGRRQAIKLAGALLTSASFALVGCGEKDSAGNGGSGGTASNGKILRVGVRDDIAGMSELNAANGKYYGLEIDIAQEMATRMGYAGCTFTTVTPDSRKETLQNGDVDCLVACYSDSQNREKNFDFSPAYYHDAIVLVCEKSSLITSVDGLKNHTFGTLAGANTAPYLAANLTERGFTNGQVLTANEDNTDVTFDTWHLLEYPSYAELSCALESGEVDAMAADGAIAAAFLNDDRLVLSDYQAAPQDYAVATQKDSDFTAPVATAIQAMLDDGTIDTLIDKWD